MSDKDEEKDIAKETDGGNPLDAVVINPDEWIGRLTNEPCPKCGANMLNNKAGDEWCSSSECNYGAEEWLKELGL